MNFYNFVVNWGRHLSSQLACKADYVSVPSDSTVSKLKQVPLVVMIAMSPLNAANGVSAAPHVEETPITLVEPIETENMENIYQSDLRRRVVHNVVLTLGDQRLRYAGINEDDNISTFENFIFNYDCVKNNKKVIMDGQFIAICNQQESDGRYLIAYKEIENNKMSGFKLCYLPNKFGDYLSVLASSVANYNGKLGFLPKSQFTNHFGAEAVKNAPDIKDAAHRYEQSPKSKTSTTTPASSTNKTRKANTSKPSTTITTTTTTSGYNLKGLVSVKHKNKYNSTAESLQRNVHNFTPYDLMTKIMGVIERPSANLDFNTLFSELRKAFPEMSVIKKIYGNGYEFDNLTIRCNNVTAFPDITFENGKYSKDEYDMFFNNMKEAVGFAKQIKADIERHGFSLEVYEEKSNNCNYGLYMEGLNLSIMTIKYKVDDTKYYVVKLTTAPFSYNKNK